ncbi:hypothetical protein TNCV_5118531 [Trichonephila clavipes]|nr:hypothetical protein TNCV_5118531 [Trichonephila clavipes]
MERRQEEVVPCGLIFGIRAFSEEESPLPDFLHQPCPWTPGVTFHYILMPNVNKMPDHPELLKQLALEVIDGIPLNAAKIYTDGRKGETNTTGSGVLIELTWPRHQISEKKY